MPESQQDNKLPILYSFRRCPYAMRARLGLAKANIAVEMREVLLRDKPPQLLAISAKATVPVLQLPNGEVLDESLDILRWALAQNDPDGWLDCDLQAAASLIAANDGSFKQALDRYKYFERHPQQSQQQWRAEGEAFIYQLQAQLDLHAGLGLLRPSSSLADIAIFPFVRQFRGVDADWFDSQPWPAVNAWLQALMASSLFAGIMQKRPVWQA